MILGLYADDSSDQKQQQIISAGAIIGWPSSIFEAERKWVKRLEKDGFKYFRSVDCENRRGEFDFIKRGWSLNVGGLIADSVRNDLVNIIRTEDGIGGMGVSLLISDFEQALRQSKKARGYYGTDKTIAVYKLLMNTLVQLLERDWPESRSWPISCTFDTHGRWQEAEEAYRQLQQYDPLCGERIGFIGHDDDKKHPPLQMADMMAYQSRLRTLDWLKGKKRDEHFNPVFKNLAASHSFYYLGIAGKKALMSFKTMTRRKITKRM